MRRGVEFALVLCSPELHEKPSRLTSVISIVSSVVVYLLLAKEPRTQHTYSPQYPSAVSHRLFPAGTRTPNFLRIHQPA